MEQGEYVYKKGDYVAEMYFVIKGKVEFLIFEGNVPLSFTEVAAGYYFGEIDILFSENKTRLHTVKAVEVTELLTFS